MKKFLVVLLACAMIFAFAATAMAADTQMKDFNDIADQPQAVKTSVMKLAILGVLVGNEGIGGAFRPDDNLTRAEFAKIVCYLTDHVKQAEALESTGSRFSDVTSGNWYTGWVNAAAASGYFVGDPGGTFRPNANITQNEVVTVALRAMGYNDKVGSGSNNNIWPANYITKAVNIEILDDVTLVGSKAATRAEAAIICAAVLSKNMVIHVSQELAFGIALAEGTADIDGFAEVYYMSNEGVGTSDTANYKDQRLAETILHKAFGCVEMSTFFDVASNTGHVYGKNYPYDEIAAWKYVDYEDGELEFSFNDGEDSKLKNWSCEVGETYYINKGYKLPQLAGLQAKVIVDTENQIVDEVRFVDVRGTADYGSVYNDSGRVNFEGKTYRTSSAYFFEDLTDEDGNRFEKSDKDNDYPAKVYFDKNGQVVYVKNYVPFNVDGFGIFDEIDDGLVTYMEESLVAKDSKFDVNKDYVLIKDNDFIKAEDLDVFDTIYYLGDAIGVKTFLVISSEETTFEDYRTDTGDVTIRIKLDGKNYRNVSNFRFSEDYGDTWIGAAEIINVDDSAYTDAVFAKAYRFDRISFVAANASNTKIIGVITKFDPVWTYDAANFVKFVFDEQEEKLVPDTIENFGGRYNEITIMGLDGKETTYSFTSDFRKGINWVMWSNPVWLSNSEDKWLDAYDTNSIEDPDMVGIFEGDIIQLVLDKKDNVKGVANFASYDDWAENGKVKATVNSAKERITLNKGPTNGTFTLSKDAVIFKMADTDDAKIVSVASVLAGNFDADKIVAFDQKKGGIINVLYIVSETSEEFYGVVTAKWRDADGTYYMINGEKVYGEDTKVLDKTKFPVAIQYKLTGGEIDETAGNVVILARPGLNGVNTTAADTVTAIYKEDKGDYYAVYGIVDSYSTTYKTLVVWDEGIFNHGKKVNVDTGDAFLYDLGENDDIAAKDMVGGYVLAICNSDGDAIFVVLVSASPTDDALAVAKALGANATAIGNYVRLDGPVTIKAGATVTIPEGLTLNTNDEEFIVNGTLVIEKGGDVLHKGVYLSDIFEITKGKIQTKTIADGSTAYTIPAGSEVTLVDDFRLYYDDTLTVAGILTFDDTKLTVIGTPAELIVEETGELAGKGTIDFGEVGKFTCNDKATIGAGINIINEAI
ncbi:MAG: S-layer homology domain-containing protein [Firmicutes bacterium]|nr:S-layer homology domain-containing protein [Bacillota bacterium]